MPAALASHGIIAGNPDSPVMIGLLGAFGPFIAAIIVTVIGGGLRGLSGLFRRLLVWRVGLGWYAFVLAWPVAFSLAKTGIAVLLGSTPPDFAHPPFADLYPLPPELAGGSPWAFLPFVFLQQTVIGSSMGEEPGWRGYALPRLQARMSALGAGVLLGVVWGIWHLPLWLTRGHPMGEAIPAGILGLVATAVLFTWVFNNTAGSLLPALLFHSAIAITGLFLASVEPPAVVSLAIQWGAVAVVAGRWGPRHLSRHPDVGTLS